LRAEEAAIFSARCDHGFFGIYAFRLHIFLLFILGKMEKVYQFTFETIDDLPYHQRGWLP